MEEKNLIYQVKQKSQSAQQKLFDKYKRYWFSICLRYNRDREDAADILQNALVNIFTKIHMYNEDKGSFRSWSTKIVTNENLMHLRKQKRTFITDDISQEYQIMDNQETPIEQLSAQELTKYIQALPVGYRTVFNLYVIEGYNHSEIADMLNITVGTSKSQLYKARKLLQRKIESSLLTEMK